MTIEFEDAAGWVLFLVIGLFIGGCAGNGCTESYYQRHALKHRAAEIDQTTGQWKWIDKQN